MDINERLEALARAPKTHRVTTHYAGGASRNHDTRSAATAETYAVGERRKIGRTLINRETGAEVRVIAVTVEAL